LSFKKIQKLLSFFKRKGLRKIGGTVWHIKYILSLYLFQRKNSQGSIALLFSVYVHDTVFSLDD